LFRIVVELGVVVVENVERHMVLGMLPTKNEHFTRPTTYSYPYKYFQTTERDKYAWSPQTSGGS
jgi:hypothetical protein